MAWSKVTVIEKRRREEFGREIEGQDRLGDGQLRLHHRQQLPGATHGHEPGEVVVVVGELVVGRHADEDDGFGVEAFGFVDGGVEHWK
jgi:hypothetical protein